MPNIVILDSTYFDSKSKYLALKNVISDVDSSIILVDSTSNMKIQLVQITDLYFKGNQLGAIAAFEKFILSTVKWCEEFFPSDHSVFTDINDLFVEIEWILEDEIIDKYSYYYDQITSIASLINSKIVTYLLQESNLDVKWLDARDLIITDEEYQNPNIIEGLTASNIQNILNGNGIFVIPNHIGATLNITTTTFTGNEVSDILKKYV